MTKPNLTIQDITDSYGVIIKGNGEGSIIAWDSGSEFYVFDNKGIGYELMEQFTPSEDETTWPNSYELDWAITLAEQAFGN